MGKARGTALDRLQPLAVGHPLILGKHELLQGLARGRLYDVGALHHVAPADKVPALALLHPPLGQLPERINARLEFSLEAPDMPRLPQHAVLIKGAVFALEGQVLAAHGHRCS